jgi:hypothetical protein
MIKAASTTRVDATTSLDIAVGNQRLSLSSIDNVVLRLSTDDAAAIA